MKDKMMTNLRRIQILWITENENLKIPTYDIFLKTMQLLDYM